MECVEQGKYICEWIEQLIPKEDKFLNVKTKLYCEYCLSLGKEYIDSITSNLYEECENYLKKFNSNEENEKQFITSYKSNLAKKGEEICKKVDSIIGENEELLIEKAFTYCYFLTNKIKVDLDSELVDRSKKYLDEISYYKHIRDTFSKVNIERRERLDMRNMKLNGK